MFGVHYPGGGYFGQGPSVLLDVPVETTLVETIALHAVVGGPIALAARGPQPQVEVLGSDAYGRSLLVGSAAAGYWRLNDAGVEFVDSSANAAPFVVAGGITFQQAGVSGDGDFAALFNGTTGYARATVAAPMAASPSSWSMSAWYNHQGLSIAGGGETLLSIGASNRIAMLGGAHSSLSVVLSIGGSLYTVSLGGPPTSGWHHVAATWSSGDHLVLYLDGAAVATSSGVIDGALDGASGVGLAVRDVDGGRFQFFHGLLDEIAWSGRAWSAAEVAQLYASVIGPPESVETPSGEVIVLGARVGVVIDLRAEMVGGA
jgi:hypothetical protein